MLIAIPPQFRKRGPRTRRAPVPPALVLVAATYEEAAYIRLTFDRAVNVAGANPAAFRLDDGGTTGILFAGDGTATLVSPVVVQIDLIEDGVSDSPGTHLTAGPNTGITADDDGGTWAGVTELVIPFL